MGSGLALVTLGVLILLDRMGVGYGLREGWPWVAITLGVGGIFHNRKSPAAWVTMIIGIFILGAKYYSLHISIPRIMRTNFVPTLLIIIGLIWVWKYKED